MKYVTIALYTFDELEAKAKAAAVEEHKQFLISTAPPEYGDNYEPDDNDVVETIKTNDYMFFKDGTLAHLTQYVEKHPRAGDIDFHLHGSIYKIE